MDEVETGPMLADGTRKREEMLFGVDAIVKDRWNLVSHANDLAAMVSSLIELAFKQMFILFQKPPKDAWRASSMHPNAFHVSCARDSAEHGKVQCAV